MRILMVTPHLPPYQSANALLPRLLGQALGARGHEVRYLAFANGAATSPDATCVRRRLGILRPTRLPQALEAVETWLRGTPLVRWADCVHIHSNTWMNQVAAGLAVRQQRPYILTHYGTEIWHYDGRSRATWRLNARARHVTFYSQALYEKSRELAVPCRAASVIYPPVADVFHPREAAPREGVRHDHLPTGGALLLNVKRLHPLADHATLLRAMALVHARQAKVRLVIAGAGETGADLRFQAEHLGLTDCVRFLGQVPNEQVALLQAAADLFVLSSVLEATPTVVLEALASGTRVVSTDNPGGVELQRLFPEDIALVPRQDPQALAEAILANLCPARRASQAAARVIAEKFRIDGVAERYLALYHEALGR